MTSAFHATLATVSSQLEKLDYLLVIYGLARLRLSVRTGDGVSLQASQSHLRITLSLVWSVRCQGDYRVHQEMQLTPDQNAFMPSTCLGRSSLNKYCTIASFCTLSHFAFLSQSLGDSHACYDLFCASAHSVFRP